jgi:glycosyltransferase involved in cell wall biosynthesis
MQNEHKPIILTVTRFYLPGFLGGGPIRSIANMVDRLSDVYEFLVITADRDLNEHIPYQRVNIDAWNNVGKAKVFYASPGMRTLSGLTSLLRETKYDVLYLNSYFDSTFTLRILLLRWLGKVPIKKGILAPRGEFSEGAFRLKLWKKLPFTVLARLMGLYRGLIWHASTELEAYEIKRILNIGGASVVSAQNILIAPDLLPSTVANNAITAPKKRRLEHLSVCFLSRLSPKKNLDFALRILAQVNEPVDFTIYGPHEDLAYWNVCQQLIDKLPKHINVTYAGSIVHEQVSGVLAAHDLFFFPTRGENFGHVFLEAWSAGLIVLTSDQTPWRDLEKQQLGWDFPLSAPDKFVQALDIAAQFDDTRWDLVKRQCRQFAALQAASADVVDANRRLFSMALVPTINSSQTHLNP